jgi:D-alanine--poly(phosphoribitol) ligase subunit 1
MMPHDVVDRFLDCANADPSHPAVVTDGRTFSYGDLERRVRAFAHAFTRCEAARVLIALPQTADAYAAILAASLAGGYHTPLNVAAPSKNCGASRVYWSRTSSSAKANSRPRSPP